MNFKFLFFLFYVFLLGLGSVEFLTYKGVVANYLSFNFVYFMSAFLMGVLLLRVKAPDMLRDWKLVVFNNKVVLPGIVVSLCIFFGLESWNYTNFVFATFGVNFFILINLALLSFFFKIFTASREYLQQRWQVLLFFGFLLMSFYISSYYPALFSEMSLSVGGLTDDNFMEWLQVFVLAVGSVISIILALKMKKNILLKIAYVLSAILFFFLIGEEISWGERLLPFEVQKSGNYQGEFNLHNQEGLNEIAAGLYIVAFLYGVVSWRVRVFVERGGRGISKKMKTWWDLLCFRGHEVLYLLPTFIFNPYADRTLLQGVPPILDLYHAWGFTPDFIKTLSFLALWRETFEVLFYAGLVIHFFQILMNLSYRRAQRG